MKNITHIHTLGPKDTNCEKAANFFFNSINQENRNILLYRTLEDAVQNMPINDNHALLGCIVYPYLHNIVFQNLGRLSLSHVFIMNTYNMVLASNHKDLAQVTTVSTHPAPQSLVPLGLTKIMANSNAHAASLCKERETNGCITTDLAAKNNSLFILKEFGEIPMGFCIHTQKGT